MECRGAIAKSRMGLSEPVFEGVTDEREAQGDDEGNHQQSGIASATTDRRSRGRTGENGLAPRLSLLLGYHREGLSIQQFRKIRFHADTVCQVCSQDKGGAYELMAP